MKVSIFTSSFLTATFCLLSASSFADTESDIANLLNIIEEPKPIKRVTPKYPTAAAREGRQGWSRFSFVIEEDGSVSNVIQLASSGSKDIDQAAKKAIAKWKYQPAMENGKPIQQCVNTVQLDFAIKPRKGSEFKGDGVSKRFHRNYKEIVEAIGQEKYEEAREILDMVASLKNRRLDENNELHFLYAHLYGKLKNKEKQLHHLNQTSYSAADEASKTKLHSTLHQVFILSIELQKFGAAINAYNELVELDLPEKYQSTYDNLLAKIEEAVSSDKNIVIHADLADKPFWSHKLLRRDFSFQDIKGNLAKLDIRCAKKRYVYNINDKSTWSIPRGWSSCYLYVYGEENASFNLVEHPLEEKNLSAKL